MIVIAAAVLFPQCVPAGGRRQEGERSTETRSENPRTEADLPLDTNDLPEVSPEIIHAFAEAGIPVLPKAIPIEDFSVELAAGGRIRLTDLAGKAIFLNFWATWCGPCRMEMPSMETVYQELKNEGLEILAVDVQEGRKDVTDFITSYKLTFPAALDPAGNIAAIYGIEAFPTTYIIDRNGGIITRVIGAINWNTPELINAFRTLLRVSAEEGR
jgi:thiol-disulfide isomerase/thioredoxin